MTRFPKTVSSSLCALVLATSVAQAEPRSSEALNLASPEATSSPSEGAVSLTIIGVSAIAGVSSANASLTQSRLATSRATVHSSAVFNGVGERLVAQPVQGQPTLGELALRGTAVGDVVRLEYIAGTEASLARAVEELKHGTEIWSIRADELATEKATLTTKVSDARRLFTETPLDEASRGLKYQALNELNVLEKELSYVTKLHADADLRMHAARGQFAAANLNLKATRGATNPTGKVIQKFHIIQDVYVDGRANQLDGVFKRVVGEAATQAQAHRAVPHVRVVRIQMPNSTIVAKSLRNMKAGLWVAGISGALILEELTVGAISEKLAEKAQTHFTPATRTEPAGAPGRRY